MKKYLKAANWEIIEEGFHPKNHKASESIFSIGNGQMGQRANFEENYSGPSLQGTYIGGVYYPDKTRVGWWKNGYPEYFAKVLNACNFTGIRIQINGEELDLFTCKVEEFKRTLDMKNGLLKRSFVASLPSGNQVAVECCRFFSLVDTEIAAISYNIKALNFSGKISLTPYLDFDVKNEDSNYEEKFWAETDNSPGKNEALLTAKTKKLDFHVCCGMAHELYHNGNYIQTENEISSREKYAEHHFSIDVNVSDELQFYKYCAVTSSRKYEVSNLTPATSQLLSYAKSKGFEALKTEHCNAWEEKWKHSDIVIEGDVEAQQGIRFNIFQLFQTYTGDDNLLNIGPKGFTGEKYGGSTYWDTEAYCFPFYISTCPPEVAKNLLIYRYKHLPKAIENAQKLGFTNGAALYPMVTMNGEESHNEWEITFEEIHRNGAIANAIKRYIDYTGEKAYLIDYGFEVLLGIARFWSQRTSFSEKKGKFVILGVTGPNEYENNVNNNWHTNNIAVWCLKYCLQCISYLKESWAKEFRDLCEKTNFKEETETARWKEIIANMYFPMIGDTNIFAQQEGFEDKELIPVSELKSEERPINQYWSWDRILRSVYIKQADVLQSLYFFENEFDLETIKANFDYYEKFTVHESSLSPCVYAVLAAKIGYFEKAYELYLRTSRLDLDDYNNEVHEGLHITSMAGTWMSVVEGFGGMRVYNKKLSFAPNLPKKWKRMAFKILFNEHTLKLSLTKKSLTLENISESEIDIKVFDKTLKLKANEIKEIIL